MSHVSVGLAIYSCDRSMKLVSVREANVTATVNSMQRYLELLVREEEEDNNLVLIEGPQEPVHD